MLLSLSGACRDIVDFDEPAQVESKAVPLLPFVPAKELKEGCELCTEDNCSKLRSACLEDDVCVGLLACKSRCKDPVCIERCGAFAKFGSLMTGVWPPIAPENARDDDYQWCIATECRDACGLGLNWECRETDTYRWPIDSSGSLPVQFAVVDELGFFGVPASVEAIDEHDTFVDRGDTGAWGQLELDVNGQRTFGGYFQVMPKLAELGSVLYYPPTLFRASRGAVGVIDPSILPDATDGQHVTAVFSMHDCLGSPASGVSFEIEGMSARSTWGGGPGGPVPGENITNEYGTIGLQGLMPQPEPVIVRAVRRGETVGRRRVRLRAGFVTRAQLTPLTGDQ